MDLVITTIWKIVMLFLDWGGGGGGGQFHEAKVQSKAKVKVWGTGKVKENFCM